MRACRRSSQRRTCARRGRGQCEASSTLRKRVEQDAPHDLAARHPAPRLARQVLQPRDERNGVRLLLLVRRALAAQLDLDVDEPAVEPSLERQVDEVVGVPCREAVEACGCRRPGRGERGGRRDELDDVGLAGVVLEDERAEDLGTALVGGTDPACGRARDAVVREAATRRREWASAPHLRLGWITRGHRTH